MSSQGERAACPQHSTFVLPALSTSPSCCPASLSAASHPADLKPVTLSPNETKPIGELALLPAEMGILNHGSMLVHSRMQTCRSTPALPAGEAVRSSLLQSLHGSCSAWCTPERGDSNSVSFFEASEPYLSLCTARPRTLCSAGKGRSTLKQDRSASSTSGFEGRVMGETREEEPLPAAQGRSLCFGNMHPLALCAENEPGLKCLCSREALQGLGLPPWTTCAGRAGFQWQPPAGWDGWAPLTPRRLPS